MTGYDDHFEDDPATRGLRTEGRDSLFVLAQLRVAGGVSAQTVRIRNLSPSGLMAEGGSAYAVGTGIVLEMPNICSVKGRVVWALDGRMGIALDTIIDPVSVRRSLATAKERPAYERPAVSGRRPGLKLR